jgi:hypothetical protein
VTAMPTQDPPQEVTTWDARMTTLQGEWVANSKSISWMLHLRRALHLSMPTRHGQFKADSSKIQPRAQNFV